MANCALPVLLNNFAIEKLSHYQPVRRDLLFLLAAS
jgi:hypothetical protein